MLPLMLNDDLGHHVQITMQASVGEGASNLPADVILVQSMLNSLPQDLGGPCPKLTVDGEVGPRTIAAIVRVQRATRQRAVDGRIEANGATLIALGQLLNSHGLIPRGVQGIGAPDDRVCHGMAMSHAPRRHRAAVAHWSQPSESAGPIGRHAMAERAANCGDSTIRVRTSARGVQARGSEPFSPQAGRPGRRPVADTAPRA
jgi:hypothetical protein